MKIKSCDCFLGVVLGLHGRVLAAGMATGVASARNCWKLALCPTDRMPYGSKTDPQLDKAEPVSDGGSAPVVKDLRSEDKFKSCTTSMATNERGENT